MLFIEAELARAAGNIAMARRLLAPVLETPTTGYGARYAWPLIWLGLRIEADSAALGAPADPVRSQALLEFIRGLPAVTAPGRAYAALAAAETARALSGADEIAAWERAVAAVEEAAEAYPLCYSLFRLAEAQVAAGRPDAAGTARDCLKLAEDLGSAVTHDVRALARRARLRIEPAPATPDAPPDARFRLTDREREVLALVAEGHSNGRIATTLYISPKTASVHVSNILAKLGVTSRTEAATTAHRHGLLAG
jgi:DNA-binding CsgD family transcriptional regulator